MSEKPIAEFQKLRLAYDGAIRSGTENTDHPEPLMATRGNFSEPFFRRVRKALELAPSIVEHVVSLIGSKGGSDDKVDTSRDESPVPFNSVAFNDANEVYQRLVYWSVHWASKLHRQAPGPAVRAWRARSGFVVGLPADCAPSVARYSCGVMASWLKINLEDICDILPCDDVTYFHDEMKDVFRINARWPQKSKPRYADIPCPDDSCKGRIAIYPPRDFGDDELIKCEGCGRIFLPAQYEHLIHVFKQIRAETNPVTRHLMRKYGRTA